jgi:tetratricopeptide (TPR) repeat protein
LIKKELDDMSGAVSDYKIAAELNPDFGTETFSKNLGVQAIQSVPLYEKYNREALVLDQQGKFPEAIALFKKAIDLKADYAEAWFNIGNTYGKTGRYSDAVAAFNKAIASKHDYAEAYAGRGIAHASLGMIQEALKDMGSAISIKSDFAMVYFNRAILYLNTGKKNLACSDLAKAVQLGYSDAYAIYEKECEGK